MANGRDQHQGPPIHHLGHVINATVSIVAALAVPGESVTDIITRADAAMYAAKKAGRNQITS